MNAIPRVLWILGLLFTLEFGWATACPLVPIPCQLSLDLSRDDPGLCAVINGTVQVTGALNYPMTCVTEIFGDLMIRNNDVLVTLVGMDSLSRVHGSVFVLGNSKLESLSGLGNLSSIGSFEGISASGSFRIIGNPLLTSLVGLTSLTHVEGALTIQSNQALASLDGWKLIYVRFRLLVRSMRMQVNHFQICEVSVFD